MFYLPSLFQCIVLCMPIKVHVRSTEVKYPSVKAMFSPFFLLSFFLSSYRHQLSRKIPWYCIVYNWVGHTTFYYIVHIANALHYSTLSCLYRLIVTTICSSHYINIGVNTLVKNVQMFRFHTTANMLVASYSKVWENKLLNIS